ncbi:MAG: transglycosylase domain-containing protein, partial [Pseudomonadota bacterium]
MRFLAGLFVTVHIYALILFFAPVPGTANMAGRVLQGTPIYHTWTPIEEISPHLVRAVIAAEDTRFCQHSGVDVD